MTANPIHKILDILRGQALLQEGKDQSDGQLLERFLRDRDRLALETLVHRHAPMVWGVCRRTLSRQDDAEDAFQATFLVLLRRADSVRPRERLANWLYGVAYKTARKARQKVALRYSHEKQVGTMPEAPAEAHADAFEPELLAQLDRAVHALPQKYRTAVVLCALQGKSLGEVAQQLRLPPGTVASRLARGRQMLAQRLAHHGKTVTATSVAAVLAEQAASGAVPDTLLNNTIKAATLLASGETVTAGLLSERVCPLTDGVLHALRMARWRAASLLLLLTTLLLAGGIAAYHTQAGQETRPEEPPEPAPQPPKVTKEKGPDPGKFGTAAGATIFARTYLLDQINDQLPGMAGNPEPPIVSPCWPSRALAATFDPTTQLWTVTGTYRREINAELMVLDHYYALAYRTGKVPPWKPQEKGWQSWEKDWKLVLAFNPSARAFEVKKAEGIAGLEEGFQHRDGKLVEGQGRRLARTDDFGKWLQGKFPKPKMSAAASVTALRLVLDDPEGYVGIAGPGAKYVRERTTSYLESKYSFENNKMNVESDSRGVKVSIDDHGAGAQVKRWTLQFGAAPGHFLKVGEYGGAYNLLDRPAPNIGVYYSAPSIPSINQANVSWGAGTGEFVVREIELQDNKVVRLAIDFITDTGYGRPSTDKRGGIKGVQGWDARSILRGSLRYKSQFPPSIPGLDRDAAD